MGEFCIEHEQPQSGLRQQRLGHFPRRTDRTGEATEPKESRSAVGPDPPGSW